MTKYLLNILTKPEYYSLKVSLLSLFLIMLLLGLIYLNIYLKNKYNFKDIPVVVKYPPENVCFIVFLKYCTFIHKFYIHNIYWVIFKIFIYFFIHFFMFLLVRIHLLNTERELISLTYNINQVSQHYFLIILFLLCYLYFIHITNLILYPSILQLHLYLHQYKKYIDIEDFYKRLLNGYFNDKIDDFYLILTDITNKFGPLMGKFSPISKYHPRYVREFMILSKKYLNKNRKIKYFLDIFFYNRITYFIRHNLTNFLSFLPHLILLATFLYDIFIINKFYYINYALLLFLVMNLNKKIKQFFIEKDQVYDDVLNKYFYKVDSKFIIYTELMLNKWNNLPLEEQTNARALDIYAKIVNYSGFGMIESYSDSIANYIHNDFKVYYYIRGEETILQRRSQVLRGLIIIIFSMISIYLSYCSNKYILQISILEIELPIIILCLPLVIMLIIFKYIANQIKETPTEYVYPPEWEYNHKYKLLFYFATMIQLLIFSILFLKNKFMLYPDEIIWNYGIVIIENFTIREKISIMFHYLEYILNYSSLNDSMKEHIRNMLNHIDYLKIINDNITLSQIKEYMNSVIPMTFKLEISYEKNFIYINEQSVAAVINDIFDNNYRETVAIYFLSYYFLGLLCMIFASFNQIPLPKEPTILLLESNRLSTTFIKDNLTKLFSKLFDIIINKIDFWL
jgi:hypothetical protein